MLNSSVKLVVFDNKLRLHLNPSTVSADLVFCKCFGWLCKSCVDRDTCSCIDSLGSLYPWRIDHRAF